MSVRGRIGALALMCAAAAAGYGVYDRLHAPRDRAAPDLALTDLDGKPHRLSEFAGKLMLVNFWASWCAPCLHEMPLLVKAQAEYGARGLQIVGPALDAADPVRASARRLQVNYPVFVGDEEVTAAMDALGNDLGVLPYSVLIAPDGQVLQQITGGLSAERLQRLIEQHLPAPP